jgi:hypothetical protein
MKTARRIRFGLSVSLILVILVHVVIFTSDKYDATMLEATDSSW